jgi:hypothetical protein
LCRGCARNSEEITDWQYADDAAKSAIWDAIAGRRPGLAMSAYRLPWTAGEIAAMIERSLHRRWGRWVLGVPEASVPFAISPDEDADIFSGRTEITAITSKGALRLLKHEKTIAVAFGDNGDGRGPEAIGLILPRGRVALRKGDGVSDVGPDDNAVCTSHRERQLFDLGLSPLLAARYCLRTDDGRFADNLSSMIGSHWMPDAVTIAGFEAASGLHVVVETGLGRAEVFTPFADGLTLPTSAGMRELPDGWDLRPVFAPCALFYPASRRPASAFVNGPF